MAQEREENLYFLDENAKIRYSHENPEIIKLYADFLEKPLSHTAHKLLHTDHEAWSMPK
jgi:NADH-quinone oxidoreductase subunit G